ncbi:MAG: hypothetical protein GXY83_29465 [Rhodopirellula sp.]|nr:hypothetical protein [Rhodopirellula sp.]
MHRQTRFELLETRWVLSAPTLATISDVDLSAGAPLHIALDGFDADGDTLTYSVSSTNSALTTTVPQGNRSMKISVQNYGDMIFQFFEDLAPRTTGRIIDLAQSGYYNGLIFHRVIEDFMIQGGDPLGTGSGGTDNKPGFTDSQNKYPFDDEFSPNLQHTSSGILSMAKSSDDTNDSQFFITAGPTRWLDFNHSIFGFLTEGDAVREQISSVPTTTTTGTDPNPNNPLNRPLTPVVMNSVTVFHDQENGVLRLSAPEGTTGQADVTVTVSDGNGGTAEQIFHVTIQADTSNAPSYLLPISPVQTTANTPVSFQPSGFDLEGDQFLYWDAVYYAKYWNEYWTQINRSDLMDYDLPPLENANLQVDVDPWTGQVTVTPKNGLVGVYGIAIGVSTILPDGMSPGTAASKPWDTQVVPVYIAPEAPTGIQLLTSSDTGISDGDGITNLDNTAGKTLRFSVSGVIAGAEVSLYADGNLIGRATAAGSSVTIETNGVFDLSEGTHSITAVQTLADQDVNVGNLVTEVDLVSALSSPLQITVDTAAPAFTSTPVLGAGMGTLYLYDAQATGESSGQVRYQLTQAPAGMIVELNTGRVTWTPSGGQTGSHPVTLRASDAAGNTVDQSFDVLVNDAPIIEPIGAKQVQEGQSLLFTVAATDANLPLTFSLENAPAGAAIDAATGEFVWATTEADGPGQYSITVKVSDATGAAQRALVAVTVTENNTPPALASIEDVTVDEGSPVDFTAVATDADRPAQAFTWRLEAGSPAGAAVDPQTGRFTWTPQESQGPAEYPITLTVVDSLGATASQSFTVTVREMDRPPVFDPVAVQELAAGERWELTVHAEDPDLPNPHPVRYSLQSSPEGVSIDPLSGEIVWDVPADFAAGEYELLVRATESIGAGQSGAASTLRVPLVIAGTGPDALLAELLIAEVALSRVEPVAAAFDFSALLPDAGATAAATDLLVAGTYDNRGLFGTRFGPVGGMHRPESIYAGGDGIDAFERGSQRSDGDAGADIDAPSSGASLDQPAPPVALDAIDAAIVALAAEAAVPEADQVAANPSEEVPIGT